jgi:hypothetical protein
MPWPGGPVGHARVTADRQVANAGAVYHGGLLVATSGGASTVNIYDGHGTDGELIDAYSVAASALERHVYERGLIILRGLYVDVGSNVSAFDILYAPEDPPPYQTPPPMALA